MDCEGGWFGLTQVYELPEDEEERKKLPNRSIVKWSDDESLVYVSYSDKDKWNRGVQAYSIALGTFDDLMTNSDLYDSWRFAEDADVVNYNKSDGDKPNEVFVNNLEF